MTWPADTDERTIATGDQERTGDEPCSKINRAESKPEAGPETHPPVTTVRAPAKCFPEHRGPHNCGGDQDDPSGDSSALSRSVEADELGRPLDPNEVP
jgi:hypothetical protein